jgi:cell division protein FtsN
MIPKIAFMLAVVLFGFAMFVAGTMAPDSLRLAVPARLNALVARFVPPSAAQTAALSKPSTAPVKPATVAAGIPAANAASAVTAGKPVQIAAQTLLIPTPLPDQAQYALQAGQFSSEDDAGALGRQITALKLPLGGVLNVVDQAGRSWSVVAIGPYASIDDARTARASVSTILGIDSSLSVIMLPPKPKT